MPDKVVHRFSVTDIPLPEEWKQVIVGTLEVYQEAKAAHAQSASRVMQLWAELMDIFASYQNEQSDVGLAKKALDTQLRSAAISLGWDPATPKWIFHPTRLMFGALKEVPGESGQVDDGVRCCHSESERECACASANHWGLPDYDPS